jgi:hypothetical protein
VTRAGSIYARLLPSRAKFAKQPLESICSVKKRDDCGWVLFYANVGGMNRRKVKIGNIRLVACEKRSGYFDWKFAVYGFV